MLLIDAHEDLAWNIQSFGRDYTRSAHQTRAFEAETGSIAPSLNGDTLLGWPDYYRGKTAVVFATLFAAPARRKLGPWDRQAYSDFETAHKIYSAQLDAYHRLFDEHPDHFTLIETQADLQRVMVSWQMVDQLPSIRLEDQSVEEQDLPEGPPVGLFLLMEGAEGVRKPEELEEWWVRGIRMIGPAWAGTRYCGGTNEPGELTKDGYALLEAMDTFCIALDLSHMDEKAVLQSLDVFSGPLAATHANPAALLKGTTSNRFLTDRMIHGIIARDGVIGIVPFNQFLRPNWSPVRGRTGASLMDVVAHIDYVCQLAGDAHHVGLGSDFDGGFGWQSVPSELDTIADLHKLAPLLLERGYSDVDVAGILGLNWHKFLERTLPG